MSAKTILSLANGRSVDLRDPHPHAIDFTVIAEHLAKEARYNGATPGRFYSVAEHCCRASDAALRATGDAELAAYVLLHDAHEAVLKDKTTPYKKAIAEECAAQFGILAEHVLTVFQNIEDRHDVSIHMAAGLAWPPRTGIIEQIKHFDLVMFVTEWRDLMRGVPHPDWSPYASIEPLKEKIMIPWPWDVAQTKYLARCVELLPALHGHRIESLVTAEHRGVVT